jgi:hypothetical protein
MNWLDVDPPVSIYHIGDALGEARSRPIKLIPLTIPVPGHIAFWDVTATADDIYHQAETTSPHVAFYILRTFGHIILRHICERDDAKRLRRRSSMVPPDVLDRVLRHQGYTPTQIQDATAVATAIVEWASVVDHVAWRRVGTETTRRADNALGGHLGGLL